MSGARARSPSSGWPELWPALPEPFRSALDPERPWELLARALDEALAALPSSVASSHGGHSSAAALGLGVTLGDGVSLGVTTATEPADGLASCGVDVQPARVRAAIAAATRALLMAPR